MALNKSNKSTPSSRSGYFSELTASAGKQTSFLLPVRIKVTPNSLVGPLSDKKKNPAKMLQPVLIKDLFQSTKKDRQNSSITSVSTQKKKAHSQRLTQPYLNTQSCHKPKENGVESSFFNRKSVGGNKVRRQLYQTLDSPQKSTFDNKENTNKVIKTKKKVTKDSEEQIMKNTQNKNRKSLLLPPNSIKNNFIKTSATNLKPSGKQTTRTSTTTVNKYTKNISRVTEVEKSKNKIKKTVHSEEKDDINMDEASSANINENDKMIRNISRNISTMTTPSMNKVFSSKSLSNLNIHERPTVIMNSSKIESSSTHLHNTEPPYSEMQNLNINTPYNCTEGTKVFNETLQSTGFNCLNLNNVNHDGIIQLKHFLEQSIQACEDQASKLKQALSALNSLFFSDTLKTPLRDDVVVVLEEKCAKSDLNISNQNNSDATDIVNKSIEEKNEKISLADKLPIPLKILVTDADLNQEAKEISSDILNEMARLSTIGEVSCEVDESNKDEKNDSENKENMRVSIINIMTSTPPKTPRTPRRKSIAVDNCDSQLRRSARLAAKRASLSMSDADKEDSFTLLENKLNVVHDKLPSKSLPASPMKPPMTPGVVRQWDKKLERPLKEYMALKMNGTFLVTPDVKRFQSCLEPTDTPHSRKSLSRKIFMELCDLYTESPESK